jgi:hypothetical protein
MRKMRFVGVPFVLFGIVFVVVMGFVIVGLWNMLVSTIFGHSKGVKKIQKDGIG